jgi:hypothetical protein
LGAWGAPIAAVAKSPTHATNHALLTAITPFCFMQLPATSFVAKLLISLPP